MDQWGQDFVDAEVEGFFEFGPNNGGSFQFGYVKGTWTTGQAFERASRASSSPLRGTTRWTRHRVEGGQSSTARRSTV